MESEKIWASSFIAEIVVGKQAFSFCGLYAYHNSWSLCIDNSYLLNTNLKRDYKKVMKKENMVDIALL